jgi:HupE / UreJ protein
MRARMAAVAALIVWALVWGGTAVAHDVPEDVRLNIFVKPEGGVLRVLVRAPLAAMTDVEFPLRGGQYLVVSRADEALRYAAKAFLADDFEMLENGRPTAEGRVVAVRASLASDVSFTSWEQARAGLDAPKLADGLDLVWSQQYLDALIEYPIAAQDSSFAMRLDVEKLGRTVGTALRFLPPGGPTRAYEFHGDPGLIYLDPSPWQAAKSFVVGGIFHILTGVDHLLFLLCLVVPFRRMRPLVAIVTAFTLAHSISLAASALGLVTDALWFPPLVETLIAATIVYMALENIVGSNIGRRWVIAFAFGLIHGFGFSFGLKETMQFAGDHLLASLLAFNIGVEIGQLFVLCLAVPLIGWFFRRAVDERMGVIVLSALVAHTAWHWMMDRGAELAKFPAPHLDALFFASLMRGAAALLVVAAIVWLAHGAVERWVEPARAPEAGE